MDPDSYATQLKMLMQSIKPSLVRKQPHRNTYINADPSSCPFVYVRCHAVKKTLQPSYNRPFKVLQRTDKHYTLDISGKKKVISLDRLKPAYMDGSPTTTDIIPTADTSSRSLTPTPSSPSATKTPCDTTHTTRSGCHVYWPKRFIHYQLLT